MERYVNKKDSEKYATKKHLQISRCFLIYISFYISYEW